MRNLKKILSVLLVVAMIAVTMVPAFAATSYTYDAQAKALYDVGLFKGVSATEYAPDLGASLTREQGIAIIVRLLGKADEASKLTAADADAALAAYTDAKDIDASLKNTIAYAVKNKLVQGTSTTTLEPKAAMTGNQLSTILLRDLGYTVDAAGSETATATLADKGAALDAATVAKLATKDLIRDDLVGIAYNALQAKDKDGKKIIDQLIANKVVDQAAAEKAGIVAKVTAATTMTAKATGAKEITVSFDGAVADTSKVTFAVKKGTVAIGATAKFADDKKSAELALDSKITASDFVVTATGVSDKDITAKFTGEDEKVSKITFSSDKAVIGTKSGYRDNTVLYVYFKILNQYNEDVTSTYYDESELNITPSQDRDVTKEGKLVIYKNDGSDTTKTDIYTYGESVPVSMVYTKDGNTVTATQVFTVSSKAGIGEVSIPTLYADTKSDISTSSNFDSYYLLFDLKDQIGNVLTFDADEDTIKDDLIVSSSNTSVVDFTKDGDGNYNFQKINVSGTDRIALPLEKPTNNLAGTALVTAVSKSTGKMAQYTVKVKDGKYAASFNLQSPDVAVIGEKVVIPFEAADADGNAITDVDDLKTTDDNTDVTLSISGAGLTAESFSDTSKSANLYFEENSVTGKPQLILDLIGVSADKKDQTVTITTTTPKTYKTSTLNLKLKEAKKPDSITAVSSSYVKKMMVGGTAEFKLSSFTVKDQYGRPYTTEQLKYQETNGGGYKIRVTSGTTNNIVLNGASEFVGTKDKLYFYAIQEGSSNITVEVLKADGTSMDIKTSFTMTAVKESDVVDYSVDAITTNAFDTKYYNDTYNELEPSILKGNKDKDGVTLTGDTYFDTSITVYGLLSDGSKVWLPQQLVTPVYSGSTVTGYTYKDAYTIRPAYQNTRIVVLPDTIVKVGAVGTVTNDVYTYYKQKLSLINKVNSDTDETTDVPFTVAINLKNSKIINGLKYTVDSHMPKVTALTLVHNGYAQLSADKTGIEITAADVAANFAGMTETEKLRQIVCKAVKAVDQYGKEQDKETTLADFYTITPIYKVGSSLTDKGDKVEVTVFSKSAAQSIKFTITIK